MHCLVVSATTKEIDPFLKELAGSGFGSREIDVLITGVGLTATTYALTKQVSIKRPRLVIQAGLCGCFDPGIPLGSVFAIQKDRIADLGFVDQNQVTTVFDLGLAGKNKFPFRNGWLVNNTPLLNTLGLKKATAVSVNEITGPGKKMDLYKKKFNPRVESMEGAALHYVCLLEQVPFIQVRSASNYIGERNKKNWELDKSIANLNRELSRIIKSL